jgi:DNA-binding MarR family transcriptional regulator
MKTTDKIYSLLEQAKADEPFVHYPNHTPDNDRELPWAIIARITQLSATAIKRNAEKMEDEHLVVINRGDRWSRWTKIRLTTIQERRDAAALAHRRDQAKLLRAATSLPVYADRLGGFKVRVLGETCRGQTEAQVRSLSSLRIRVQQELRGIASDGLLSPEDSVEG